MQNDSEQRLHGASLADKIRDRLRASIMDGELKPGEKINIERVAAMFAISRTPVREAIKALEMEGLVRIEPHRGAMVETLALKEVEHRFAVRLMIEAYAAQIACIQADDALRAELTRIATRVAKEVEAGNQLGAKKMRLLADLNREFRHLIWKASGSAVLIRLLESLQLPQSFSDKFWAEPSVHAEVSRLHQKIAAAFEARDAELVKALVEKQLFASAYMIGNAASTAA